MAMERRIAPGRRVQFEKQLSARIIGIDGTWHRDCAILDISDSGAKLMVSSSLAGLHLSEFFLLLSTTGRAYRRCEMRWCNGDHLGVKFIKASKKKPSGPADRVETAPGAQKSSPGPHISERKPYSHIVEI